MDEKNKLMPEHSISYLDAIELLRLSGIIEQDFKNSSMITKSEFDSVYD